MEVSKIQAIISILIVSVFLLVTTIITLTPVLAGLPLDKGQLWHCVTTSVTRCRL